jgi:RNA polymerase sigma-70 factor (ECF subfamily)
MQTNTNSVCVFVPANAPIAPIAPLALSALRQPFARPQSRASYRAMQQSSSAPLLNPSDADLAARMVARDRGAFEQIYDRYSGKALGLIIRILNDRGVSEEVLQEAFWRVWQRAETYDANRASFASWLFSIVHHCAIDELRKQRSRTMPTVEVDAPDGEAQAIPDPQADVAESAWANLQSDQVKRALAQLPEAQRAVIMLAYYGGYTRHEIAARLDEPIGTVHTRARLGLLKLRDLLSNLKS